MAVVGKDTKQPQERLDWDVDFGDWMRAGDSIDMAVTSVRRLAGPEDAPLEVSMTQHTLSTVKVWLVGGANGARYRVEVQIETVMGRIKEAEFDISVKEV